MPRRRSLRSRPLPAMPAYERPLLLLLILAGLVMAGLAWLGDHPQHNPWAPLDLRHPQGWATTTKLAALREDPAQCHAVLERSEVHHTVLDPTGSGTCLRADRVKLDSAPLTPDNPQMTCPVAAAMVLWIARDLQPLAVDLLGSPVARIEHLGTYNCRRIAGSRSESWSEHATGNAIDIAAVVLDDGTRISVLADWEGEGPESAFLHAARDTACGVFGTVLSPDYNAAHADHLHLDQGRSPVMSACR